MSWKTKAFPFVFVLVGLFAGAARGEENASLFTYARLYCSPDGNTHFQDVTVELRKTNFAPPAPPIHIGSDFAASKAFFGGFDAGWGAHDLENRLNHPHSGNSIRHRSARHLFHHHDRRRNETTAARQRLSAGGHLALQRTYHRRGR
jgi:hypothetical protein